MLGFVAPFLLATVAMTAPQRAQVPAAAAAPKPAAQDVESSSRRLVELLTEAQAAVRGFEAEFEETTQAEMTESPTTQTVRSETTVTGKLVCGARFCVIEPTGGERVGLMDEHGQAIRRPGEVVRSEVATLPIQGVAGLRIDPNGLRGFGLGPPSGWKDVKISEDPGSGTVTAVVSFRESSATTWSTLRFVFARQTAADPRRLIELSNLTESNLERPGRDPKRPAARQEVTVTVDFVDIGGFPRPSTITRKADAKLGERVMRSTSTLKLSGHRSVSEADAEALHRKLSTPAEGELFEDQVRGIRFVVGQRWIEIGGNRWSLPEPILQDPGAKLPELLKTARPPEERD